MSNQDSPKLVVALNIILKEISIKFELALKAKTGWGKDEVLKLYKDVVIDVLLQNITSVEEPKDKH